jgi:hypothetical protein
MLKMCWEPVCCSPQRWQALLNANKKARVAEPKAYFVDEMIVLRLELNGGQW